MEGEGAGYEGWRGVAKGVRGRGRTIMEEGCAGVREGAGDGAGLGGVRLSYQVAFGEGSTQETSKSPSLRINRAPPAEGGTT